MTDEQRIKLFVRFGLPSIDHALTTTESAAYRDKLMTEIDWLLQQTNENLNRTKGNVRGISAPVFMREEE